MLVCWSVGGGVGTSVVVAGLALATVRGGGAALIADLGGDQPRLFGAPSPSGPGLAQWLDAAPDVGADALARLEVEVAPEVGLLPRGHGAPDGPRAAELVLALASEARTVVVDAGRVGGGGAVDALVAEAEHTVLVVRACPLMLARLDELPSRPHSVIVVRDRRRAVTWQDIAEATDAPVVAELEIDPAVAAAVDAGLDRRSLPRSFLRALGAVR